MARFSLSSSRRGFAIIAVMALLVLLAIITVALLQVSTVDQTTSLYRNAKEEADANARMALSLAVGELQKYLGPDQRISARAETLVQHPQLVGTVSPNTPKSWWVGAAHSDQTPVNSDGDHVIWLVSGLDPALGPKEQIEAPNPFSRSKPVVMFDEGSIDLTALTGGKPIEAGLIDIRDKAGDTIGAYAFMVDDNGMKAQLAASNPLVVNESEGDDPPLGRGTLPGTFRLDILNEMAALKGKTVEDYLKVQSLNDLQLLGLNNKITKKKYFAYTHTSQGVLSDTRLGGLKRDLTIAFERSTSFNALVADVGDYLIDEGKLETASDLQQNGYIHWKIFRDYYNLKKHLKLVTNDQGKRILALDQALFSKEGLFNRRDNKNDFHYGRLGPHELGDATVSSHHRGAPYGDLRLLPARIHTANVGSYTANEYKHNPITPVLSLLQQNGWVDYTAPEEGKTGKLRTRVQLWTAHYNPYNIGIVLNGDTASAGPRVIHFPQVEFTIANQMNRQQGLHGKRQSHVSYPVVVHPGRSHLMGFKAHRQRGGETDNRLYSDRVKNLVLESVFFDKTVSTPLSGEQDLTIDFRLDRPSLLHGSDQQRGSYEVSQAFFSPFAWENVSGRPGKRFSQEVTPDELNENSMVAFSFGLRTTTESSERLRPLIDANIRAMWGSAKWDSPLNIPAMAGYSVASNGVADHNLVPLSTEDDPKGYTYLGAGNDPVDGYDRVLLFDIPREDLVSLGQLQHASAGRFSYEPTYIVGNSYANTRIPSSDWSSSITDTFSTAARGLADWAIPGSFNLYDASYLVNEVLWDSHVFTTIPQIQDDHEESGAPEDPDFASLLNGSKTLRNPRFLPYIPAGSSFDAVTLQNPQRGVFHNAGHLLVDGMFNINSTSVDAWEAFLSGTHRLPYQKMDDEGRITGFSEPDDIEGTRFPRVKAILGDGMKADAVDDNYWTGFRDLTPEEIRKLAKAIVDEIKYRGPFLSLSEFVNRKLESGDEGKSGALQAALDATVNQGMSEYQSDADHNGVYENIAENSNQGAGFPGQLLQGDILQALSPYMQPRSDSFTIRTYGESRSPRTGKVMARSWCEAVVQRIPDPVENPGSERTVSEELASPSSPFGRQFRLISFRWLNPDEI